MKDKIIEWIIEHDFFPVANGKNYYFKFILVGFDIYPIIYDFQRKTYYVSIDHEIIPIATLDEVLENINIESILP